jgi:hypothetical protein
MSKAANEVTHMFFRQLDLNSPFRKYQSVTLVHGKKFAQCNKAGTSIKHNLNKLGKNQSQTLQHMSMATKSLKIVLLHYTLR